MIKVVAGEKTANAQPLTPIDLIYKDACSVFALVYNYQLPEEALIQSLNKLLDINPYIGGRLSESKGKTPAILGNNQGIIFSTCYYDNPLPEHNAKNLIKLNKDAKQYLFEMAPNRMDERTPLIQIKISQYTNGSILCVSFSHALCDVAIFTLLREWSRLSRNEPISLGETDRNTLTDIYEKSVQKCPQSSPTKAAFEVSKSKIKKVGFGAFELSGSYIDNKYEESLCGDNDSGFISRQDFVMALILKEIIACIDSENIDYAVEMARDIRKLMGLPASYFGNAVAFIGMKKNYLFFKNESILSIARSFRKTIMEFDRDKVCGSLNDVVGHKKKNKDMEKREDLYIDNRIYINNYTKTPIYDIDFGSGSPVWAESLTALTEKPLNFRLVIVWPSPSRNGGVVYHVTLPMSELRQLKARLPSKSCIGELG